MIKIYHYRDIVNVQIYAKKLSLPGQTYQKGF